MQALYAIFISAKHKGLALDILNFTKEYVFTIVIGVLLAYIAYQQLVTNRHKLKLDLYNKRFEVYTVTLKFHQELAGDGSTSDTHKDFINHKEAAKFLFSSDPSIYQLLDEMHVKSFKINAVKNNQNYPKTLEASKESLEAVNWCSEAVKDLSRKLEPFLAM
jgi:hypothetical protein